MRITPLLSAALLLNLAVPSSLHAQATSVKRITRQLPSSADPIQPPPAPPPPGGPGRGAPLPPSAPPNPQITAPTPAVKPKTDTEKAEILKRTIDSERRRAEAGSDSAQYSVGMRYARGDGVERNYEEARKWLEKSAKQGNATAAKRLEEIKDLKDPERPKETKETRETPETKALVKP